MPFVFLSTIMAGVFAIIIERKAWRRIARVCLYSFLGLCLCLGLWFTPAVYHRVYLFPRIKSELNVLRSTLTLGQPPAGWKEFKGVVHSHSHLSHDCEVSFEEILSVLQRTGRDFICMSDHCTKGLADFSLQWRGLHEGKLFIPGFEMRRGFMPFGVASNVVLTNSADDGLLAQQIAAGGGLLFYAHPEEPRDWDRAELAGMEIYNTHADFKDERWALLNILPDVLLNHDRHPDLVLRTIFDRPTSNLIKWDALNRTRHISGVGGNDCHQNAGLRIWCTATNTIRVEDTSPKTLFELRLNLITRLVASGLFGKLDPGRKLFQLQLDPYELMVQHVTTHVWAHALNEQEILDSLRIGRGFVGFDLLVDSTGFVWFAENATGTALPGEHLTFDTETHFRGHSPCRCRITILKDGTPVYQTEGESFEWQPSEPGIYRVEAELRLVGKWTPWVYSNPIRLPIR